MGGLVQQVLVVVFGHLPHLQVHRSPPLHFHQEKPGEMGYMGGNGKNGGEWVEMGGNWSLAFRQQPLRQTQLVLQNGDRNLSLMF